MLQNRWENIVRIDGCIEFASASGFLGGWVRCEDPEVVAELALVADDVVIVRARPDRQRDDFGGMFGYWIEVPGRLDLLDLILGRVKLLASVPGVDTPMVIGPLERVREQAVEDLVQTKLSLLEETDLDRLMRALKDETADRAVRLGERHVANRRKRDELSQMLGALQPAAQIPASCQSAPIEVPLGHLSLDGTAVVGQQGFLFLVGGSNSVLSQYLADPDYPTIVEAEAGWLDRISGRSASCRELGTRYLQLVVPEKLGVLRELLPWTLPASSPLLHRIETAIMRTPQLAQAYVSGRSVLDALDLEARCGTFLRTDSHLSYDGIVRILRATLDAMGLPAPEQPDAWKQVVSSGDLDERFFGVPLFETIRLPAESFCDGFSVGLELTEA